MDDTSQPKMYNENKEPDWEKIRNDDFSLSNDYVYMNNSSFGATLNCVQKSMETVNKMFAEGFYLDRLRDITGPLSEIRKKVNKLISSNNSNESINYDIGFVNSVTEGMSLVANGLTFKPGDVILTTDHEHAGGRVMWELQEARYNARLLKVPLIDNNEENWKEGLIKRFENELERNKGKVKVLSFSLCTCSTGHILPAKEMCALAKKYGVISVVDAAQAWAVMPIDMTYIDCDFMVMNGHKYLCGPIGSGFLVVNPRRCDTIGQFRPTIVDEYNYPSSESKPVSYKPSKPESYNKGGVAPYTNVLPLKEALAFYCDKGPEAIYRRLLYIGQWLRKGLSQFPEFEIITPMEPEFSCVMSCFRIIGKSSKEVNKLLKNEKNKIHVRFANEGEADAVRLSPHYYNTEEEFMHLAKAICDIASVDVKNWPPFIR